jgi:hypothetical protein
MKHPPGAYDQIFLASRQLRVCWCGALSLTRWRVCRVQLLLLVLASLVIFGSQDHILLSQTRDFPFRRLLRLAGLRWRYSNPLLQRNSPTWIRDLLVILRPTVSRPVCLGIKPPYGAYDHIFITVKQLRVCWYGASSLTRGRVCLLQCTM